MLIIRGSERRDAIGGIQAIYDTTSLLLAFVKACVRATCSPGQSGSTVKHKLKKTKEIFNLELEREGTHVTGR
jgi:hypothetical protein